MPDLRGPAPQTKGGSDAAEHSDAPDRSSALSVPARNEPEVRMKNLGKSERPAVVPFADRSRCMVRR